MKKRWNRALAVIAGVLTLMHTAGAGSLAAEETTLRLPGGFSSSQNHSTIDILAGSASRPDEIAAGVKIKLKPGWKTYWRTPGQSGIPPSFDWSRSKNVAAAVVHWPAPTRYSDNGETIYGYKDEVVFPISITPKRAGEPVELELSLFYAVCRDICVPVQAEAALEMGSGPSRKDRSVEIAKYERLVPRSSVPGLELVGVGVDADDDRENLLVSVATQDDEGPVDVFVESALPGVIFGEPKLVSGVKGERVYRIPVDMGKKSATMRGAELELTLVQEEKALARKVKVD